MSRKRAEHLISSMTRSLTQYFLEQDAHGIEIKIDRVEGAISLEVKGEVALSEAGFLALHDSIDQPKGPDIEYYYSELLDSADPSDLSILGTLVDEHDLHFEDNVLRAWGKKRFKSTGTR